MKKNHLDKILWYSSFIIIHITGVILWIRHYSEGGFLENKNLAIYGAILSGMGLFFTFLKLTLYLKNNLFYKNI